MISEESFRNALSRFATGVTIVTLEHENEYHGLTVNSFTSVSLNPPLILICIQRNGKSHALFRLNQRFVVNILSQEQRDLASQFADSDLHGWQRFHDLKFNMSQEGIPIIADSLAYLECQIVKQYEGGDHTIFLGEVNGAWSANNKKPLLFFESQFAQI
ncbi:MAG: flavin reductase family protein [bacterium]